MAVGGDFAGLLVQADLVGGEEGGAVADEHAVGSQPQTGLEIELGPALIVQRFHFPGRLLLSAERAGERQGAQGEREDEAQSCHLAVRANQNPRDVPSGISGDLSRTQLPQGEAAWHVTCEQSEREQDYGCQSENVEAVAGDSWLCPNRQPASSAPESRVVPGANSLAGNPRHLAPAKTEHHD